MSQLLSPPHSPRDHRHYVPRRPSPLSLPPIAPHLALPNASTSDSNTNSGTNSFFQPFSNAFQSFSLTALVESPKTGTTTKIPRYPLEKQRRAWKEIEMARERNAIQKDSQDKETQDKPRKYQPPPQHPMEVPLPSRTNTALSLASNPDARGSSTSLAGSITSLPLTPRSARSPSSPASSKSSRYSQLDEGDQEHGYGGQEHGYDQGYELDDLRASMNANRTRSTSGGPTTFCARVFGSLGCCFASSSGPRSQRVK